MIHLVLARYLETQEQSKLKLGSLRCKYDGSMGTTPGQPAALGAIEAAGSATVAQPRRSDQGNAISARGITIQH